jgi:p-hydroxybenzoate 3-monooxygenase
MVGSRRIVRTQVAIIGAGPAGLTLALLLQREGIESVVIEDRTREYVEHRVRAGLLEQNTTDLMHELGVGDRLDRDGLEHRGIYLRAQGRTQYIAITDLTGRHITIYAQQEVVKDMAGALVQRGGEVNYEVGDVAIQDFDADRPRVTYSHGGVAHQLECDFIAGCDGFHGICRPAIADQLTGVYEFEYPFGWLGILAEAAPATDELIYAWHEHGFALYSMRSPHISRLYIQVPLEESIEDWSDDRIWAELQVRMASEGWRVNEGRVLEKGITPMRTFVCEPMQYGNLFLAGDSAHIVPPTGAKGLNLAINDSRLLAAALSAWYGKGSRDALEAYTDTALRRVWRAQDFSSYMTRLLHDLGTGPFDRRLQLARLEYISRSTVAATSLAENYAGLPATPDF